MRRPKRTGAPIDNKRIAGWVGRFPGYRREVTRPRLLEWIRQFNPTDQDLAARVLDSVTYVTHEAIDDAFRRILNRIPGWHPAKKHRAGRWRFVALSRSAGESGHAMLQKWRLANRLTAGKYDELFIDKRDLLRENLTTEDTVVFLDDFAGTGQQASTGWKEVIAELLPGRPRTYLVLVACSTRARQRITDSTPLRIECHILLGAEDDIFSGECLHFSGEEKAVLLQYCSRADRRNPRGFGDCGFVVVLAHRTPNNSIPILHSNHQRWVGLFPRH